jgi:hypothetical protein
MRGFNAFLVFAGCLALSSCGGGGGGGGGGGPVNGAPTITSPGTASVAEGATGTVYQATATDPDGNAATYSISGTDAARFTITAAGALSFVAPPDFEAPTDSDANNVYLVTLVASDGQLSAQIPLSITVTNVADSAAYKRVATVPGAVEAVGIPGSNNLFVLTVNGRIFLVDPQSGQQGPGTLFMTLPNVGNNCGFAIGCGALSIVPAPDYATSGVFYVSVSTPAGPTEVRRYRRSSATAGDVSSGDVILTIPTFIRSLTQFSAELAFGPDGFLYVLTGQGGNLDAPQTRGDRRGKVLRIDVSQDAFPADPLRDYAIPSDNPSLGGTVDEVYALGLYNPQGAAFRGADLLFGDNTPVDSFEVNLLRPQDKGANYGYPFQQKNPPAGITSGVVLTGGPSGFGVGGRVYRGPGAALQNLYLYSSSPHGVHAEAAAQLVQGTTITPGTPRTDLNPPEKDILSFAEDSAGNLYILVQSGSLYKLEVS